MTLTVLRSETAHLPFHYLTFPVMGRQDSSMKGSAEGTG